MAKPARILSGRALGHLVAIATCCGMALACGGERKPEGHSLSDSESGPMDTPQDDGGTSAGGPRPGVPSSDAGDDTDLVLLPTPPAASELDAGGNCGASPFGAEPRQANVLLVMDKSKSMAEKPEGFEQDKWTVLQAALSDALGPVQNDLSMGLLLYPYPDGCGVELLGGSMVDVALGRTALPEMLGALAATQPSGGTPTTRALTLALEYYTEGPGAELAGSNYVLLATDGGPTCNDTLSCSADRCVNNLEGRCSEAFENCCDPEEGGPGAQRGCLDDAETLAAVEDLAAAGIDTFVVGIPGSEAFSHSLNQFAEGGGQPNLDGNESYYMVDDAPSLTSVLESITRSLITRCELVLESTPPALDRLNVEVEGEVLPQGEETWTLDPSTSPPTIVIHGETCARIESEGVESVRVVYGCPTIQVK